MPSNAGRIALRGSTERHALELRSNAAPADVRIISVASFDVKPTSFALTG